MNLFKAGHYQPRTRTVTAKPSAVIVLIVGGADSDCHYLLLRRTKDVRSYPGDWCLPGGRKDPGERDLLATAWRELEEETAITRQQCQLLCQLDDFYNGKGELVRPFIVTVDQASFEAAFSPQESEVVEARLLACEKLSEFALGSPPNYRSTRNPAYHLRFDGPAGEEYVWGLTASILAHAHNIINGNAMPIDYGINYYISNGSQADDKAD
jgi:8-oxo-dGTP pyrophosphatase MutT (NUDIX family)